MVFIIIIIVAAAIWIIGYFMTQKNNQNNQPSKISQQAAMMEVVKKAAAQSNNKGFYWKGFKQRKPALAAEIESVTGRNLDKATDIEAFEIVTTFQRWSENANCPIGQLKEYFINSFSEIAEGMDYESVVNMLKSKRAEEAANFNISLDNTITSFMLQWYQEKYQEKHEKETEAALLDHIAKKLNLSEDEKAKMASDIQDKMDELNLAPDISGLDREENRLIALAEEGVDYFSNTYKTLNNQGRIEALIYCTTCLIDLPTNYENELDLDKKEDRYFLLLHDKIICSEIDDTASFINSRIEFYNEQKRKLKESTMYTPMFIYNAFYMNQLCEHPEILKEFNESPVELLMMKSALNELDDFFAYRKEEIL